MKKKTLSLALVYNFSFTNTINFFSLEEAEQLFSCICTPDLEVVWGKKNTGRVALKTTKMQILNIANPFLVIET